MARSNFPATPRVGGNGFDRAFPVDFADARESLPKNLDLVLNLFVGRNVLVVASAAALKQRAGGGDSIGGVLAPLRHAGADQLWSLVKWLDFHLFAGKHKRNKRDVAVKPPKALAAINKLFDYNRRAHRFRIPGGGRGRYLMRPDPFGIGVRRAQFEQTWGPSKQPPTAA